MALSIALTSVTNFGKSLFYPLSEQSDLCVREPKPDRNEDKYLVKRTTYFSHRYNNTSLNNWPFQVKKDKNKISGILEFFMFNTCFIKYNIDDFLSRLRISNYDNHNPKFFTIEDYTIEYYGYSTNHKNYSIKIGNIPNLIDVSTDEDKLMCAKFLIFIMNEINEDDVNMYNYNKLIQWFFKNAIEYNEYTGISLYPLGWENK